MSERPAGFAIRPDVRIHPGSSVSVLLPFEGQVDIFVAGADGNVWSANHSVAGAWQPCFRVRPPSGTHPGSPVTVLQTSGTWGTGVRHIYLFATGTDGSVRSTYFHEWVPWVTVGKQTPAVPGSVVTAHEAFEGHVDLFVVGADYAVWTTYYEDGDWRPWRTVRQIGRFRSVHHVH